MRSVIGKEPLGKTGRFLAFAGAFALGLVVPTAALQQGPPPRPNLGPGESNWSPPAPGAPDGSFTTTNMTALTPTQLAQAVVGPGIAPFNVTYTGANVAAGTFTAPVGILGLGSGAILGSGNIASVSGPNTSDGITTNNGMPGDPQLTALAGFNTFDAAVLEFDFNIAVPQTLSILYRFTSDEYNEFVNTSFNDVFAFFLNGTNIALIPSTVTPVAINNVNCNNPFNPPTGSNCNLYVNNDCSDIPPGTFPCAGNVDTEMDGLTTIFTTSGNLLVGTNHIKLAIADAGDSVLDSNVFIQSITGCPPTNLPPTFGTASSCGGSFKVGIGSTLCIPISASDPDPGQTVCLTSVSTNGAAGLPPGGSLDPGLPTCGPAGGPVITTFCMTPPPGSQGTYNVVFTAEDPCQAQSACTITILVDGLNLLTQSRGSTAGGELGYAVTGLGDLDGDGKADFAVGAPGADEVRIVSGASGDVLLNLTGAAGGQFGCAIAAAGDLNGDGVNDLLVGAREALVGGVGGVGQARAVSGATGAVLHTFDGVNAGDAFGCALSSAGDVDGDGVNDIVVGAPGASPGGLVNAGQVRIFSGANGASIHAFDGGTAGARFGFAVVGAGDLNGDGRSDVLVGAPGASLATAFSGASGAALFQIAGTSLADQLGAALAVAGDVNHDGTPDLLVGAPYADPFGLPDAGEVRLISGANGSLLRTYTGIAASELFGAAVASPGDVDNDGTPDVLVGIPSRAEARVFSGWNGYFLLALKGASFGEGFGAAVSTVGDVDGDGLPDLLVGASSADPCGSVNAGVAVVLSPAEVPASMVSSFGSGSAGSGGTVPSVGTMGGAPYAGNASFHVLLSDALGGSSAILFLGTSATNWNGVPLPLPLAFLGMPGASLHVAPHFSFARTTCGTGAGVGYASVGVPFPLDPTLSGSELFFQWYVVDPGPFPFPGAVSNAVRIVIQ